MKTCDLHTHSNYSDGSFSPAELVALAKKQGLSAVALTDHNTAAGLPEFVRAAREQGIKPVPGCEFTTGYKRNELHVVGLFFPESSWPEIEDFVDLIHEAKRYANRKTIEALRAGGYDVTYEEAAALCGTGVFNRAHIAQVLVAKRMAESVRTAFDTVLSENGGFYVPAKKIPSLTAIRFIRDYGGVPVLAHPLLNMKPDELELFLPKAKKAGLAAIETMYSGFTREMTGTLKDLARRFGLLESGGSDFHGSVKPGISLGCGTGDLRIPYEICEKLEACAKR